MRKRGPSGLYDCTYLDRNGSLEVHIEALIVFTWVPSCAVEGQYNNNTCCGLAVDVDVADDSDMRLGIYKDQKDRYLSCSNAAENDLLILSFALGVLIHFPRNLVSTVVVS